MNQGITPLGTVQLTLLCCLFTQTDLVQCGTTVTCTCLLADTLCEKLEVPATSIKLSDQLGRGNFGTVHKACWNVAVKVIQQQPHSSNVFYMKLLSVPQAVRVRIGKQVASAIQYMHTANPLVLHRDLKCDNILVWLL